MATSLPPYWDRLDPDALLAARAFAAVMTRPLRELGPAAARELLTTTPIGDHRTPVDRVEEMAVPTRSGPRRARLYCPTGPRTRSPRPALLYLHGGGFVLGGLDGVDAVCRVLADRSGWTVVSLDYRLAPEHPYPGALDDSSDAFAWLRESALDLGIDADMVAVGGDSAGANLATALCLRNRDRGLPLPACQALVYPAVDDTFTAASWTEFADAPLLNTADARWCWEQYVGPDHGGAADWYAAPMKAESLRGLPPALVLTAEVDPLRDDAEAYAERMRNHDVPVTAIRYAGVFHGFFTEVGLYARTDVAVTDVAEYLCAVAAMEAPPPQTI